MRVDPVLLLGAAWLIAVGCSSGTARPSDAPATVDSPISSAHTAAPAPSTPLVKDPRDARGRAPCDLLTPAQLTTLGLIPSTGKNIDGAPAPTCSWRRADDQANTASVQIRTGLTLSAIEGLELTRATFVRFEATEVSGHPAFRADRTTQTGCSLAVAIADYQGLATNGDFSGHDPDPCARSRRMA
jgi:hypothetical protein